MPRKHIVDDWLGHSDNGNGKAPTGDAPSWWDTSVAPGSTDTSGGVQVAMGPTTTTSSQWSTDTAVAPPTVNPTPISERIPFIESTGADYYERPGSDDDVCHGSAFDLVCSSFTDRRVCPDGTYQTGWENCDATCTRQPICVHALAQTCPRVNNYNGFPIPYFTDKHNAHVTCSYTLGDFYTEDDVKNWNTIFRGSSHDDSRKLINDYFCKLEDNIKTDTCTTYCDNAWNTKHACKTALETYCSQDDRALNDDFCYLKCNLPGSDERPSFCDDKIPGLCALVPSNDDKDLGFTGETFYGNKTTATIFIVIGIMLLICAWKSK